MRESVADKVGHGDGESGVQGRGLFGRWDMLERGRI